VVGIGAELHPSGDEILELAGDTSPPTSFSSPPGAPPLLAFDFSGEVGHDRADILLVAPVT
jgi:hypothetical protein